MKVDPIRIQRVPILCLICLLILGLLIFKDYGISLDEPAQRLIGIVNLKYVAQVFGIESILLNPHFSTFTQESLANLEDRHYGVIFELPAALLEFFFKSTDEAGIYHARHLLTFFYFLAGLASIYKLAKIRFLNWQISTLACAMIVFSPRIFADSFYNDKDIVFLSLYVLTSLTMIQFIIRPNLKNLFIHAFVTALAIDTRLIAIIFPFLTTLALIGKWRHICGPQKTMALLATYLLIGVLCIVAFWPYLWSSPLDHFIEAFRYISRHPHSASIQFMGDEIPTDRLPWYYAPFWIAISTPIVYLGLFLCGAIISIHNLIKKPLSIFNNQNNLIDLIFLTLLLAPICAVAITRTPIYNGWRHLYFTYPFLILISLNGIQRIWILLLKNWFGKWCILTIIIINFAWIGNWMIQNHPLQNLYFNFIAGKNWNNEYEVDYWGLAHKLALDKLIKIETNKSMAIWPGRNSKFKSGEPTVFSDQLLLLPSSVRSKIYSPDSIDDTKYVIASNKAHYTAEYLSQHGLFKKIDSVKVDKQTILSIFYKKNIDDLGLAKKNKAIFFGKNEDGIFYLLKNTAPPINWELWDSKEWQSPEDWGVWSKGQNASINIPINSENMSSLSIRLRAFLNHQNPTQNTQVWINDQYVASILISDTQDKNYVIPIPKNTNLQSYLKIDFKGLKPASPKALGINSDGRDIAIGLISINFQ